MTTDLIKNTEIEKAIAAAGDGLFRQNFAKINAPSRAVTAHYKKHSPALSHLTKNNKDQDHTATGLEKDAHKEEGWARCMDATVALLNHAHQMIEKAEQTIKEQENRIQTLEQLSTTDELTNIQNRRGFFDHFAAELDRCDRGLSQGGLLMLIDLDNFKTINDTYGHLAGDASLRLVAKTLQAEIRMMDIAARLGGDEFVLLFSNTNKVDIAARAQALAWKLNHLSLAWYGEEIPVRASLGLQPYKAGDEMNKIFNAADCALYAQKFERKRSQRT